MRLSPQLEWNEMIGSENLHELIARIVGSISTEESWKEVLIGYLQ